MGLPVSQYITDLKIEKAKNLLRYSAYRIVDIAAYTCVPEKNGAYPTQISGEVFPV